MDHANGQIAIIFNFTQSSAHITILVYICQARNLITWLPKHPENIKTHTYTCVSPKPFLMFPNLSVGIQFVYVYVYIYIYTNMGLCMRALTYILAHTYICTDFFMLFPVNSQLSQASLFSIQFSLSSIFYSGHRLTPSNIQWQLFQMYNVVGQGNTCGKYHIYII